MLENLIDELCLRKTGYLEACEEMYDNPATLKRYEIRINELDEILLIISKYNKN